MIHRRTIECSACKTRVVARTAIGSVAQQSYSYPCPGCGVGISYALRVDTDAVDFEYDRQPTNGVWIDDEDRAVGQITFDGEALLPGRRPNLAPIGSRMFSPFLIMSGLMRDLTEYQRELSEQLFVIRHRDHFDRMLVHIENQNLDLLHTELVALGSDKAFEHPADLRLHARRMLSTHRALTKDYTSASVAATDLFADATNKEPEATAAFVLQYVKTKRLLSLWRQARTFRRDFFTHAPALTPLLQTRHWKEPPEKVADCMLFNKQFDALKALYIDGFETLARFSVIMLALHYLATSGAPDIPTNSGSMDIWKFEKLHNANKGPHLAKVPSCAFLAPFLDTSLRNGIGHNAAHYDPGTDEVVIYKQDGADLKETRMPYTVFADRVLELASVLLEVHLLAFWMLEISSGALA